MKRRRVGGFEQDAFSRWGRKYLIYLGQAGTRKKAKKKTNRRERREARDQIRRSDE